MPSMFSKRCRHSTLLLALTMLAVFGLSATAFGQATSITSLGYRANEGGSGAITAAWTTGNLGNTWAEGEWVAYQLLITDVQTDYPNLDSFPDILMSYDFTSKDNRFVDLVRSIQAGTGRLVDGQGWPMDDGTAYPDTTRPELEDAQNDVGNTPPLENEWNGFTLLNLPNSQVNRGPDGISQGTPTDAEHTFRITKADLVGAGIPLTADTIVIYYQLHESRSFVWANSLQDQYDQSPTDDWGGYLYSLGGFPSDARNGSGYVPGSSGHIEVEFAGGAKTVPIPIPERLPGAVSGLKWHDENGDGVINPAETTLANWRIYVTGSLEGINFATDTVTGSDGTYSFPNLTSNVTWSVFEESQSSSGWTQTYPMTDDTVGVGYGFDFGYTGDTAAYGWKVALTRDFPDQDSMNFGNMLCEISITCPPDDTIDCSEDSLPSNTGFPTIVSNCGPDDTTYTDQRVDGDCDVDGYLYYLVRTWIATNDNGMADTCVQYIYVTDTTPPQITCPDTVTVQCIEDVPSPNTALVTTSDDCSQVTVAFVADSSDGNTCPETIARWYSATDECGNVSYCSQTIIVNDTIPPDITCPDTVRVQCIEDVPDPNTSLVSATDNCGNATVAFVADSSDGNTCPEVISRYYSATDDCENVSYCIQTIIVDDTIPPDITCPDSVTVQCMDDVPDPNTSLVSATDNCGNVSVAFVADSSDGNTCPTEISRYYSATDDCGNVSYCVQTITVNDTIPPDITCPDSVDVQCYSDVPAPNTSLVSATDNCGNASVAFVADSSDGNTCPMVISRYYSATDDCGNVSYCIQTITVNDTVPPSITCPNTLTVQCRSDVPAPNTSLVSASDNCGNASVAFVADSSDGNTCPETISRWYSATDDCGNVNYCSQTIIVNDTIPPDITCPDTLRVQCIDDVPEPNTELVSATDNCGNVSVAFVADSSDGNTCPEIISRYYSATDDCSNVSYCMQTIVVDDTTRPVLSGCPDDDTLSCEESIPAPANVTATDNCDDNVTVNMIADTTDGDCPYNFTITRTWTAVDSCGNQATCSQILTVVDTTPPTITCADPDTIACEDELVFTPPTASDLCDTMPRVIEVRTDTTAGPGFGEYIYTRYWYAVDTCGNASDTCSQSILREQCPEACTFTIGGWGSGCPESQAGDPMSTQPGCIRDHYFDDVYPGGYVEIGDASGYTARWTSAAAVEAFLPDGGTPSVLTSNLVNPTSTPANVLASQILGLRLNVDYSCAGVFETVGLSPASYCYGDEIIGASCGGPFAGLTVSEFLAVANLVVSGQTGVLSGYGATISDVNSTATCLNELHDNCDPFANTVYDELAYQAGISAGDGQGAEEILPTEFALDQNYPNPFNPVTQINFALPQASHVTIEIYNIVGQKVTTLVDAQMAAGYHSVSWNAANNASGVYFYRLTADSFVETKKMLLLK